MRISNKLIAGYAWLLETTLPKIIIFHSATFILRQLFDLRMSENDHFQRMGQIFEVKYYSNSKHAFIVFISFKIETFIGIFRTYVSSYLKMMTTKKTILLFESFSFCMRVIIAHKINRMYKENIKRNLPLKFPFIGLYCLIIIISHK